MSEQLKQRIRASLLGVQLGDAIGMPVEMMSHEEILKATRGKGVTGPMDAIQSRIDDTRGLKSGETTDDWQLTRAVAKSLIARHVYDQRDMAMRHIREFHGDNRGWGGTTKIGIQSLIAERSPFEVPDSLGPGKGCGNGVAIKIAPIALFCGIRWKKFRRAPLLYWVMEHGKLTHPDLRAAIAAYALAAGIMKVMHEPLLPRHSAGARMLARRNFLDFVTDEAVAAEQMFNCTASLEESVSWRIDQASRRRTDPDLLRTEVGTGCYALESVPFALATFARHYGDFRAGILEAVNAGGDTDSNASMVGALIGANDGDSTRFHVPSDWLAALEDEGAEAEVLGAKLYEAAHI